MDILNSILKEFPLEQKIWNSQT